MNNLNTLKKYFPVGRGETEVDYISDIFVLPSSFYDIITPDERSIRLLIGNKGSGKSALLEYLKQKNNSIDIPTIIVKPDNFSDYITDSFKSIAILKNKLFNGLINSIAIEVGGNLSGLLNKDETKLFNKAFESGKMSPSLIKKALTILLPLGKALSNIDFEKMLPAYTESIESYKRSIGNVLQKNNKYFYVLIDDTDQIILPSEQYYLEYIWSFILASQKVAETLPNIKFIITLKTEVWNRISQDDHGARDQVDHFRQMIRFINPEKDDIANILRRRLNYSNQFIDDTFENIYQPYFKGNDCKLPRTNERRTWEDYLVTASRFRPRDTIQLVNMLANECLKKEKSHIDDNDVDNTALEYSKQRVRDLINENEYICPQLEVIIKSFYKIDFELNATSLLDHLKRIPGTCRIEVKRNVIRCDDEYDAFVLWKLLFDIEFITPRKADSLMAKGYKHIRPNDDVSLVCKARWNDLNKFIWDVHPCYRSYLMDIKDFEDRSKLLPSDSIKSQKGKHTKKRF
jgi:hypothetical protein